MQKFSMFAMALVAASLGTSPALAKKHHDNNQTRYEYDGRYYDDVRACEDAKRKASKNGTIVGAATAGVGAAILGANLGETALIAGGGALVGRAIGKSKKC